MGKYAAFLMAIVAALALAIFATTPPAPVPKDAPLTAFSAERAMEDVRIVARAPHPTGSAENAVVRDYILGRMKALGMEVSTSDGIVDARGTAKYARWTGRKEPPKPLTNLIGIIPGSDRSLPAVMLMAHHDTVWKSPGAADDTAGVAAALEVVRAIRATGQPRRDVIILLTDGEELGLLGAKQFFASHPLRERVGAILNLEARGGGGRVAMFQTSNDNGPAMSLFAKNVGRPNASSLGVYLYKILPNNTDLTPALDGPYLAFNFAFVGRPELYHSPMATPDRLDRGSLQDMGDQALDLTRGLLQTKDLPPRAPDAVFFDLFGLMLVIYPAWVGWIMLGLTIIGFALSMRGQEKKGLIIGAGRMVGLIILASILLYAFNLLSLKAGEPNYYDRLAAIPRLEALALLVSAAATAFVMASWKASKPALVGAALPILFLAIGTQAIAPPAAYILVVPLMLFSFGMALADRITPPLGVAVSALVATIVTGFMLAHAHPMFQGVGPTLPMVAALPLALSVLSLLPLWPGTIRRTAVLAGGVLMIAAAGVAISVKMAPIAETVAAYADTKS